MEGLLKNIKLTVLHDYPSNSSGSTGTTGSNYVDMAGYDGVMLLYVGTEAIASAVNTIYPVFSSDYSGSTFAGSTAQWVGTTVATTAMEQMVSAIDIVKPLKRYVSCYNYKLTAASGGAVIALQYNFKKGPISQSTSLYGVYSSTTYAGLSS
jgi:hypothetical protein